MRSVGLALLVAATGCNQILGLHEPILIDASPDAVFDVGTAPARLTFISPVMRPSHMPQQPELPPIEPAPVVQYGRLGGQLVEATYLPDGSIDVPADMGARWRLVYTLSGEPPREVQFSSAFVPQLVVPYFGGHGRAPLPAGSAVYQLAPSNAPATFTNVRVFTTGAWSERDYMSVSSPLMHDLKTAVTVRGPLHTPDPAEHDRVVILKYEATSGQMGESCVVSKHGVVFATDLDGNMSGDPPMWPTVSAVRTVVFEDQTTEQDTIGRIRSAVGANLNDVRSHYLAGFTTGAAIPQEVFVRQGKFGAGLPNAALPLPAPPMVLLGHCTQLTNARGMQHTELVDDLTDAPRLGHVQLEVTQMTGGIPLRAGYTTTDLVTNDNKVTPMYRLALAYRKATLGTANIAPNPLASGDVQLETSDTMLELTFELDDDTLIKPDFFEVTLARITGANAQPVRIYTVTEPKVVIETEMLERGVRYVLGLRSVKGAPRANENDYTRWVLPQAAGLVWTRTFVR
jgi:hypothetical protein